MSLKSVELQVAIPRSNTAGKIQDQLQKRPQNDQTHLANAEKKSIDKQQQRTIKTEKTDQQKVNDQQKKHSNKERENQNKERKNEQEFDKKKEQHPYKGHSVDISL